METVTDDDFDVSGNNTISGDPMISGFEITITVGTPIVSGETVTVDYTGNMITDVAGKRTCSV